MGMHANMSSMISLHISRGVCTSYLSKNSLHLPIHPACALHGQPTSCLCAPWNAYILLVRSMNSPHLTCALLGSLFVRSKDTSHAYYDCREKEATWLLTDLQRNSTVDVRSLNATLKDGMMTGVCVCNDGVGSRTAGLCAGAWVRGGSQVHSTCNA
eukprot:1098690-Pelagomonas_calceolata.AAC.3